MNPGPTNELVYELYRTSANYEYWAKYVYPQSSEKRRVLLSLPRAQFVFDALKNVSNKKNLEVVEFGSGSGDVIMLLNELLTKNGYKAKLYSVDPSPDMEKFYLGSSVEFHAITFDEAVSNFNRENKSFDLVFSFEVMEHLLNPSDCLNLVAKILKPGGGFIFSTPNAHSLETIILKGKSTTFDIEHISVLTPIALNKMAEKVGMTISKIETPGKLDLELISNYGTLSRIVYKLMDRFFPKLTEKIRKFISSNLLSSHSRYVLIKSALE